VRVVFCQVEVSATNCLFVQGSPTKSGASLCAIVNEEALAKWGLSRQEQTRKALSILVQLILKSGAIPLQAWTDREGSRGLRTPDFKTIST
jgi:hypothetical protein